MERGTQNKTADATTRAAASQALDFALTGEVRAIVEADAFLAAIVESSDDAIFSMDIHGTLTTWNKGAERIFGYRAEEVVGKSIGTIIPADRVAEEEAILARILRGEQVEHFETVRRRKDGSLVDVSITVSPIKNSDGSIIGASKISRDITQRKRIEQALRESEERFRLLFENQPTATYLVEPNTLRILDCNERAAEALGYTREEMCRLTVPDIDVDLSREEIAHHVENIVQGKPFAAETRHRTKTGEVRDVFVTARPIHVDGRTLDYATAVDITERKQHEQALRESENRFRSLAENIPHLAWMTDAHGWITWYNRRWFEYTGTAIDQMQGWGWQSVHHPDHLERVTKRWKNALETGQAWEDTFPLRGKNGHYRWFLSRAFPIRDASGNITHWFGTNTDIHELRETQKALHEAQQKLQQRATDLEKLVAERTAHLQTTIAELESFSYSLSHDMRAPLRTIESFSEIVLAEVGDKLGSEPKALLERIISSAGRLDRLIQDVLVYSKVARESIQFSTIDLEPLLRQIIHERSEFQPPKAQIEIQTPLPLVSGHEAYLTQIVTNLLDNAVKFVDSGQTPHIRIWSEQTPTSGDKHPQVAAHRGEGQGEGSVRIWFEDNGIGVPKDYTERIFSIFQRVHADHVYPGTGIGLAIVRKAAERMGGAVGVESELGKGSRFWVQLNCAK